MLDDENMDVAAELATREQLRALAATDLDEEDERKRWERVRRLAPGVWENSGARAILQTVVAEAVRKQLGV